MAQRCEADTSHQNYYYLHTPRGLVRGVYRLLYTKFWVLAAAGFPFFFWLRRIMSNPSFDTTALLLVFVLLSLPVVPRLFHQRKRRDTHTLFPFPDSVV